MPRSSQRSVLYHFCEQKGTQAHATDHGGGVYAAKDVRIGKGGGIAFINAHSGQDGGAISAQTLRVEAEGRPTFTRGRADGRGGARPQSASS